jgi:hypothetical protein
MSLRLTIILNRWDSFAFLLTFRRGAAMPDQTTAVGMERKLAAIFNVDVVGYRPEDRKVHWALNLLVREARLTNL